MIVSLISIGYGYAKQVEKHVVKIIDMALVGWMHEKLLPTGRGHLVKTGTAMVTVQVTEVKSRLKVSTLEHQIVLVLWSTRNCFLGDDVLSPRSVVDSAGNVPRMTCGGSVMPAAAPPP